MSKVEDASALTRPASSSRREPAAARTRRPRQHPRKGLLEYWRRRARDLPEVRTDLVRRIRAEIEAGTYETEERLNVAVERMLKDLREPGE